MRSFRSTMLACGAFLLATPGAAQESSEYRRSVGLMVGDPIAAELTLPVGRKNFFTFRAGVWSWRLFEQPIIYDVPYLSADFGWQWQRQSWPRRLYVGVGLAFFFQDNPKDNDVSDGAIAVRVPLGLELFGGRRWAIDFELAPIHQIVPWYVAGPYGIELNGGVVGRYRF